MEDSWGGSLGMAVMPALASEPGGPLTPYHLRSFIRLDHILTPGTATRPPTTTTTNPDIFCT